MAPCGEASLALINITDTEFKAKLEASFASRIASDLNISKDLIAITSVTTSNRTRRRILLESANGLVVAFKVIGEAEV